MPVTRKYSVTIEKEIEITLPDEFLTDEYLQDYGSMMYGYTATHYDVFEDAVKLIARGYANSDNDGFGQMHQTYMKGYFDKPCVYYDEIYEDVNLEEIR